MYRVPKRPVKIIKDQFGKTFAVKLIFSGFTGTDFASTDSQYFNGIFSVYVGICTKFIIPQVHDKENLMNSIYIYQ